MPEHNETSRASRVTPRGFEQLEARVLLSDTPLPSLNELTDRTNSVVRLETNFGTIDLEMFDSAAPNTVENFIGYVYRGDYDGVFFHRYARLQDNSPFVIQGGLARLDENGAPAEIVTQDPIVNEFGMSNVERTLAMAKLGGDPDSATSQWFFNLQDNSANLDEQNGGFTVFARVLNDRSWAVVEAMTELQTFGFASPYNELPVAEGFDPDDGVQQDELAVILDAEVIKEGGKRTFYGREIYFHEGLAGQGAEFLTLANHNSRSLVYQVIVRTLEPQAEDNATGDLNGFYTPLYRDRVVWEGRLAPNASRVIVLSDQSNPSISRVPDGVPYTIQVQATRFINGSYERVESGSSVGEVGTDRLSTTWAFADAWNRSDINDTISWINPGADDANIDITVYWAGRSPTTTSVTGEALRRGEIRLADLDNDIAPGVGRFSVVLTSDVPITAGITRSVTSQSALQATSLGNFDAPSRVGVIPSAIVEGDGTTLVSFINPNPAADVLTLRLSFSDGRDDVVISDSRTIINGDRRTTLNLATFNEVPRGVPFSLTYQTTAEPVYASSVTTQGGAALGNPAAQIASTKNRIASQNGGVSSINDITQSLSLVNPNNSATSVTLRLRLADGTRINETIELAAGSRVQIDSDTAGSLFDRVNNTALLSRFWLDVRSTQAIVVGYAKLDDVGGLGFGTLGFNGGSQPRLDTIL